VSPSSIRHAPPSSGGSYLLVLSLLVSPQTDDTVCTVVAAFCAMDRLPLLYPSSNRESDTTVGSLEGAKGTTHIEARATAQARETPHSYPKP